MPSAVERLSDAVRPRANLFATRDLKGVGPSSIWTLEWQEQPTVPATLLMAAPAHRRPAVALRLRHGERRAIVTVDAGSAMLGRGRDCPLRLDDPELRISAMHVLI